MIPLSKTIEIGITNKCTLLCPQCPRTKNNYSKQLVVKFLDSKLLINTLRESSNNLESVGFVGTHGDCIYYSDFIPVIKALNSWQHPFNIYIETNGNNQRQDFWKELVINLKPQDNIVFGIDGSPANYTKYRVNGDWNSLKMALEICKYSSALKTWKYILFDYNANVKSLIDAYQQAKMFDMDFFKVIISERRGSIESSMEMHYAKAIKEFLDCVGGMKKKEPKIEIAVSPKTKTNSNIIIKKLQEMQFGEHFCYIKPEIQRKDKSKIESFGSLNPLCMSLNWANYLDVDGLFYPCCYTSFFKRELLLNGIDENDMDVRNYCLEEIVKGTAWQNIYQSFIKNPMRVCTKFCSVK